MSQRPTTLDEARVYGAFKQMQLKERVTYVLLGIFVIAFGFMIYTFCADFKTETSIIVGAFDALLSPTVYLMCKHYFPAVIAAQEE